MVALFQQLLVRKDVFVKLPHQSCFQTFKMWPILVAVGRQFANRYVKLSLGVVVGFVGKEDLLYENGSYYV